MLSIAVCVLYLLGLAQNSAPAAPRDEGAVRVLRAPEAYSVLGTALLNDAARREREVGWQLRAELRVLPVWARDEDYEALLRFELISPQLYGRGKHINADYALISSVWDSYPHSTFYAHWRRGRVLAVYLDTDELTDVQNFKRSLISLFQFQVLEGEHNETDVSGECQVQYETLSVTVVRKVKKECRAEGWGAADAGALASRRLTRYTLSAAQDALQEVHAEELHAAGLWAGAGGAGLKARAFLRLARAAAPAPPVRAASLAAALAALPASLRAVALSAAPPDGPDDAEQLAAGAEDARGAEAELAAAAEGAALAGGAEAGRGGAADTARAALRLLAAVRAAPAPALHALLAERAGGAEGARLAGVCAALGLAGSARAHAAALRFLRLRQRDAPHGLAHEYFAALAVAERPQDSVVEDALRLGSELQDAELAESALLAAAASARRASARTARAVRDALVRALAACADEACRRVRVAALGNMRRADAADALLAAAERGDGAAVRALEALSGLALSGDALARLERLALGAGRLEARAAALDALLLASVDGPFWLPRVLLALQARGPAELLRLAWARLRALAAGAQGEHVRRMLAMLPLRLRGWDAQALAGTSAVLVREAARGAGAAAGWGARLESLQVARGALLRRGLVRLLVVAPDNSTDAALSVELWTRGLEAFAGSEGSAAGGEREEEAEAAGGGLVLAVGGAERRALTLFSGQAELLGHVWAGTGSEPTAVLRALRPLPGARAALPVLGGGVLRFRRSALAAAALDADAQLSLWARTARANLALRAAVVARGELRLRAAWGELSARAEAEAEPRLRIAADLDFYSGVALCVRAHTADHQHAYNVTLRSQLGAARRGVRRARAQRWPHAGRTLALGAPNDATCRTMGAASD